MMEDILNDLRPNNLEKYIKGQEIKGADALNVLANELYKIREQKTEYLEVLNKIDNREKLLLNAAQYIVEYLEKELPLVVIRDKYIITVDQIDLTIQKNVI